MDNFIYPNSNMSDSDSDMDREIEETIKKIKINKSKKEEVVDFLKTHPCEVLMTLGAGDIDALIEPIEKLLNEKH